MESFLFYTSNLATSIFSALYSERRKPEAVKLLRMAAAYDSSYNVYLEQCEKDEEDIVSDLVSSRRGDY